MNKFWSVKEGDVEYLYVYCETSTKLKLKLEPMAVYFRGNMFAQQYRVVDGSKEQVVLFTELGITPKDKVKNKRRKKDDAHD